MLKLISYTDTQIAVTYSDCNLVDIDKVQSVSVYAKLADGCESTSYNKSLPLFTLDGQDAKDLLNGKAKSIAFDNILKTSPEVTMKIFTTGNYPISYTVLEDAVISGLNAINDFAYSNEIKLGSAIYEIDKLKSTLNRIIVKSPIKEVVNTYQVVTSYDEYLIPVKYLEDFYEPQIVSLKGCDDGRIPELTKKVIKLMALQKAIRCGDKEVAIELYRFLKPE